MLRAFSSSFARTFQLNPVSMKNVHLIFGSLIWMADLSPATIIGCGQSDSLNTTVSASLGSNALANGNGFVVTNGTTPNISVTWDAQWDIHTSTFFTDWKRQRRTAELGTTRAASPGWANSTSAVTRSASTPLTEMERSVSPKFPAIHKHL